ncbi:hypothetical protein HPB47_021471, partial [Ixodes persulcatus]
GSRCESHVLCRINKLLEFNRSAFYRRLDEDQKEIDQNIDVDEVITFWRGIWATDDEDQEFIDLLDAVEIQTEAEEESVKRVIEEIKFLRNRKKPGPDGTKRASQGKELRPITCLPNIYKLLSKVVIVLVTDLCEVNEVISAKQMGTRRGCRAPKQQALFNKVFNQKHNNELFTSWIDIQKANDSVQHDYLAAVLTKLGMPENVIKFVKRRLAFQRISLVCRQSEIGQVRINKVLL